MNNSRRVAPRAARTATSFCRVVPLASSKLATFTQAINSTNPTAPISKCRVKSVSRGMKSLRRSSTRAPQLLFDSGWSWPIRRVTTSISACALASDTPGFMRPITSNQ